MSPAKILPSLVVLAPLGAALFVQTLVTIAIAMWGRRVARRMGNGSFWRRAAIAPWVATGLIVVGAHVTIACLIHAFGGLDSVDPSDRARTLGAGISSAMNVFAMFVLPGEALLALTVVTFVVGSVRPARTSGA
jgi:hypothetical protein